MASLSIGEALAALAILLLLPSLLNPLASFRLRVSRFSESFIHISILTAFVFVVVSYVFPENITILKHFNLNETLRVLSSVLFAIPIFAIGYAYFGVPKFNRFNHQAYLDEIISLISNPLSIPNDFSKDLQVNLSQIIKIRDRVNWAKVNDNAFYAFTHRKEIEYARSAYWITEVCLDNKVLKFLVENAPTRALRIIEDLRIDNGFINHPSRSKMFIRELTSEFLENSNSPLNNEVGYVGLSRIQLATRSLFPSGLQIIKDRQLNGAGFIDLKKISEMDVKRLLFASELVLDKFIEDKIYWEISYFDLLEIYKRIFSLCRSAQNDDEIFLWSVGYAISKQIKKIEDAYNLMTRKEKTDCFLKEGDVHHSQNWNIIRFASSLVYEFHSTFANKLDDRPSDDIGSASFDILGAVFPHITEKRPGVSALQQQLILRMMKKVDDNISGYYPAFIRPLLTFFGPFHETYMYRCGNAYDIFHDTFFCKMRSFPDLAFRDSEKSKDQLTSAFVFDLEKYEFIYFRSYGRGSSRFHPSSFPTSSANLFDVKNHR